MNSNDTHRELSGIYASLAIERIRLEARLAEYQDEAAEEHF